jgi:hypothetical protein
MQVSGQTNVPDVVIATRKLVLAAKSNSQRCAPKSELA